MDWAVVVPNPNLAECSWALLLVYKQPLSFNNTLVQPVTLRLQGILGHHNLFTFGTWNEQVPLLISLHHILNYATQDCCWRSWRSPVS